MATQTIETAAIINSSDTITDATERIPTAERENAHDECQGCQALEALEDVVDMCLEAGLDRDRISEVLAEKLWKSAQTELFGSIDACVEDGWPLADILEEVQRQHAFIMKAPWNAPEIIPTCDATLVRDAA